MLAETPGSFCDVFHFIHRISELHIQQHTAFFLGRTGLKDSKTTSDSTLSRSALAFEEASSFSAAPTIEMSLDRQY